jgi:uncharacterized OB-fold protein
MTAQPALGHQRPRRAIREGLLLGALSDLSQVRLAGTCCAACGETSLGSVALCPNCGGDALAVIGLSNHGSLWTYTVARHRPPGNYRGPEPFAPFGMGLVELPEGVRVLATLDCAVADLQIGLPLQFKPYLLLDSEGAEVVTFGYASASEAAK